MNPAPSLPAGGRVALHVEYDGRDFQGWQRQRHTDATVQQALETALGRIADAPVQVWCAGRTDTGVHGLGQVVHFVPPVARPARAWLVGGNRFLPDSIAVSRVTPVPDDFHARFSAVARRYIYLILNRPVRSPAWAGRALHFREPLDAERMDAACPALLGERDFAAFQAASCSSESSFRDMQHLRVTRRGPFVLIDVQANAFLHHMVRNLVGSLLKIGTGAAAPGWLAELQAGADRTRAAATARPDGLYLWQVRYPDRFGLSPPAADLLPVPPTGTKG